MAASRRCRRDRVGGLQRRHDLARGEGLDLELVVGRFRDVFGEWSRTRPKACRAISGSSRSDAISSPASIARWRARQRPTRQARGRPISGIDDVSWLVSSLVAFRIESRWTLRAVPRGDRSRPTIASQSYGTNPAAAKAKKPRRRGAPGLRQIGRVGRQVRVRVRIMKVSKLYSATCHHRYWSLRKATQAS